MVSEEQGEERLSTERDEVKAKLAHLGSTARGIWEAFLALPQWAIEDINDQPPPPLWHTHVTITESEIIDG